MLNTGQYVDADKPLNMAEKPAADTRDRILEAAGRVFARKGYNASSLDQVAREAGMTKGAIYWHFSSKNDLFFALLDSRFQLHTAPLSEDVSRAVANGDPKAAITAIFRDILHRLRQDEDWPRLYLEFMGQARDAEVRARLSRYYDESWQLAASLIEQMKQGGVYPPHIDAKALAMFWTSLVDGLLLAWLANPSQVDHDRLASLFVDMLWRGIAPPSSLE